MAVARIGYGFIWSTAAAVGNLIGVFDIVGRPLAKFLRICSLANSSRKHDDDRNVRSSTSI